jgi:hypothetical protein
VVFNDDGGQGYRAEDLRFQGVRFPGAPPLLPNDAAMYNRRHAKRRGSGYDERV